MSFKPFSTTGIGSMPHHQPYEACKAVLQYFDIPFWPQLPKYSLNESMIAQFSEGLPGIVFDKEKIYLKKDEKLITEWLSNYTDEMESFMTENFAAGLHMMEKMLKGKKLKIFKGQVTGPVTFSLSLKDERGKPIYFDETLRELSLLHLKAKAKWQINFLKNFTEGVIIFIDEPILQAVGTSTYISVENSETIRLIKDFASFIKSAGALAGVHCCGRTDWKQVLSAGIDIFSFDAFFFFDFFKIYKEEIAEFVNSGGYIAWGFVPTTDNLKELKDEEIINQALKKIGEISKDVPLINKNSLITPSCGMGSLQITDSERVCKLLRSLKKKLNE
uniref:Methionine synthase n=1 Tax=Thermodesulfovibrio aggregans TaxID=86166 RepID=A0A7C4AK15_9BACT